MIKKSNKRIGHILFLVGIIFIIIALFLLPWVKIEYSKLSEFYIPPEPLIFTAYEFEKVLVLTILVLTSIIAFLYIYRSFLSPLGYLFFGLEITIFIHYSYNSISFPTEILQRHELIGFYIALIGIILQIIGFSLTRYILSKADEDIKLKKKETREILRKSQMQSKKRSIIAFLIVLCIIISGYSWYLFIKPLTIEELLYRKFEPGDTIELTGEIEDIQKYNTTYGPITTVILDDLGYDGAGEVFSLLAKGDKDYRIGNTYQTQLHFKEFRYNKNKIVTAEELFGTYLLHPILIQNAINSIIFYAGIGLKPISMDGNGTTQYEVMMRNGDTIPLDLTISLKKGVGNQNQYDHRNTILLFHREFIDVSGDYDSAIEIDYMTSLRDNVSINKSIHYIDKNSNNLLDDYDILEIKIPPTPNKYSFESYFLQIGDWKTNPNYLLGAKYIINWYKGQFEVEPQSQLLSLQYLSSEVHNITMDTKILVARAFFDKEVRFDQCSYRLDLDDERRQFAYQTYEEKIEYGTTHLVHNMFIEYIDSNENMLIDEYDIFIVKGLENQPIAEFSIIDESGNWIGHLKFISGYGHLIGYLPRLSLEGTDLIEGAEKQYRIDIKVDYWHPQLELNSSLRISISENDFDMNDIWEFPYHSGIVTQYNGINVTYFDADNDSDISTGDYIIIEDLPEGRYNFRIFLLSYDLGYHWIDTRPK